MKSGKTQQHLKEVRNYFDILEYLGSELAAIIFLDSSFGIRIQNAEITALLRQLPDTLSVVLL